MGVSGTGVDAMSGQGSSAGAEGTQGGAPANAQQLFAHDIEEEANSHFQRIYTSEIQIEAVVEMLKAFKTSTQQREQEVFACMIHNLFDEYRFFPRYPERELLITGKLFGSLIQHQLVSSITLGIALRYVLEALRKPFRSNMFRFGMCALEEFKSRLVEWPQYCHHMLQIAHIRQSHVELIEYIQNALQGRPMLPEVGGSSGAARCWRRAVGGCTAVRRRSCCGEAISDVWAAADAASCSSSCTAADCAAAAAPKLHRRRRVTCSTVPDSVTLL